MGRFALVTLLLVSAPAGEGARPVARTSSMPVVRMGVNDSRSGAITHLGATNVYEFVITRPGVFRFAIRNIPKAVRFGPEIAELQVILTGPKGFKRWSDFTVNDARHYESPPFALPLGTYRLEVKDYFDDAASPESYTLQTMFVEVNDPGEPNDTPTQATPLQSDQPRRGYILPESDLDYYRIHLDKPGRVSISITDIPREIREGRGLKGLYLGILDQQGRLLRQFVSTMRRDHLETGQMVMNVGTYYLCVRDFNKDNFSASPYTIVAHFPQSRGQLSPIEKALLEAVRRQFLKSDDRLDTEERNLLRRLEIHFLED